MPDLNLNDQKSFNQSKDKLDKDYKFPRTSLIKLLDGVYYGSLIVFFSGIIGSELFDLINPNAVLNRVIFGSALILFVISFLALIIFWRCLSCGAQLIPGGNFCPQCGIPCRAFKRIPVADFSKDQLKLAHQFQFNRKVSLVIIIFSFAIILATLAFKIGRTGIILGITGLFSGLLFLRCPRCRHVLGGSELWRTFPHFCSKCGLDIG